MALYATLTPLCAGKFALAVAPEHEELARRAGEAQALGVLGALATLGALRALFLPPSFSFPPLSARPQFSLSSQADRAHTVIAG